MHISPHNNKHSRSSSSSSSSKTSTVLSSSLSPAYSRSFYHSQTSSFSPGPFPRHEEPKNSVRKPIKQEDLTVDRVQYEPRCASQSSSAGMSRRSSQSALEDLLLSPPGSEKTTDGDLFTPDPGPDSNLSLAAPAENKCNLPAYHGDFGSSFEPPPYSGAPVIRSHFSAPPTPLFPRHYNLSEITVTERDFEPGPPLARSVSMNSDNSGHHQQHPHQKFLDSFSLCSSSTSSLMFADKTLVTNDHGSARDSEYGLSSSRSTGVTTPAGFGGRADAFFTHSGSSMDFVAWNDATDTGRLAMKPEQQEVSSSCSSLMVYSAGHGDSPVPSAVEVQRKKMLEKIIEIIDSVGNEVYRAETTEAVEFMMRMWEEGRLASVCPSCCFYSFLYRFFNSFVYSILRRFFIRIHSFSFTFLFNFF